MIKQQKLSSATNALQLPALQQARVLVVGDVMLDKYWHGQTSRISPEAPVPICHVKYKKALPGGAGNVAVNISAVGAQVTLLCAIGDDDDGATLCEALQLQQVKPEVIYTKQATINKLRVISQNQQLLRLDFEEQVHVDAEQLQQKLVAQLASHDVVVFSDYAKGTLTDIANLLKACQTLQKPILVDPKGRDFSRYRGATMLTPNRHEFEAVVGPCATEEELISKAQQLLRDCELQALLITRSSEGMTLVTRQGDAVTYPVATHEVYDVTGAGDTVIALIAACLAAGSSLPDAVQIANIAASCVVAKFGAATVSWSELSDAINYQQGIVPHGVLTEHEVIRKCQLAKAQGKRIVMTNGCFDILHLGHVTYLRQAKALGDILIIAVNDDASVKRLKGPSRPVNSVEQRMVLLAELACVDYVVAFSEDTPERIITAILPDVLVKGGDYEVSQIAGASRVLANGGDVKILPFVPGCSTTNIIAQLLEEQA